MERGGRRYRWLSRREYIASLRWTCHYRRLQTRKFCLPLKKKWATHDNHHVAPFLFHYFSSCSIFSDSPFRGERMEKKTRNYESVHDSMNRTPRRIGPLLVSIIIKCSLSLCGCAFAIKITMMTNAISIALPTEFLALYTTSYASFVCSLSCHSLWQFINSDYLLLYICFFLIARNVVLIKLGN